MQVLQGSLVALVTPMLPNGDVDYSCLENLIDWHIGQGTNGIVSVGTTGESATLNVKEHLDVIAFTVKHTNKRIPVIAGSGANSTREAIDLTKESKRLGADYALIVTPYYNKPNQLIVQLLEIEIYIWVINIYILIFILTSISLSFFNLDFPIASGSIPKFFNIGYNIVSSCVSILINN